MKNYNKPTFELVKQDESNKVFFAASVAPASAGAALGSMTVTGPTAW